LEKGKYLPFKKKVALLTIFTLLVLGISMLTFNIKPAKGEWTGTVYIRGDGSIDPPTAPILTFDCVAYTFIGNIYGSIVVERDGIIIDGANYTVDGYPLMPYNGVGIDVDDRFNVTIMNTVISDFYIGISLSRACNITIFSNKFISVHYLGGGISSSGNAKNNRIELNTFYGCSVAVGFGSLEGADENNILISNNLMWCENGFVVHGKDNVVLKNVIYMCGEGIVSGGFHNIIAENKIEETSNGIMIFGTSNFIINNNILVNSSWCFIGVEIRGDNHIIRDNIINVTFGHLDHGIYLMFSENNTIERNCVWVPLSSLYLHGSKYNTVRKNNIWVLVLNYSSNWNIITENNLYYFVFQSFSNYNKFYHNNVWRSWHELNNSFGNVWDAGYPIGGNYWNDCIGVDLYGGPFQNETGNDGIGDTPYIIDEYNVDHYPLMNPWTLWFVSSCVDVKPDVLNLGVKGEWVTVYIELPEGYNVSDIDVSSIRLNGTIPVDINVPTEIGDHDGDGVPDLMVKFNRTDVCQLILSKGIKYGNVTMVVSGILFDGTVFEGYDIIRVRMPGDLNMDGKVDLKDISIASRAFGSYLGHERWNQMADENEDDKIDLKDIALICRNFGKTY
jgi:hypothetical protein